MRTFRRLALSAIVTAAAVVWAADWPMLSGGPQRNGWAKSERLIDKTNVSGLRLLYKIQVESVSTRPELADFADHQREPDHVPGFQGDVDICG